MAKRAREDAPSSESDAAASESSSSRAARPRKTIIFIRHGQSEYNLAIRETGEDPLIRDAGLTAKGRQQAKEAKEVLSRLRAQLEAKLPSGEAHWLLAASPLRRALDTASEVWPEAFFGSGAAEEDREAGSPASVRFEIFAGLRELITGCDDLGSAPADLLRSYPHLRRQLSALPQVWWTVPPQFAGLPPEGDAMREAFISCPGTWEDADEDALDERRVLQRCLGVMSSLLGRPADLARLTSLVEQLAEVPEELVVIVAHCDLIRRLAGRLRLAEDGKGWGLRNCECRVAEGVELRAPTAEAGATLQVNRGGSGAGLSP